MTQDVNFLSNVSGVLITTMIIQYSYSLVVIVYIISLPMPWPSMQRDFIL